MHSKTKTRAGRPKTLVRRHRSLVWGQRPDDEEGSVLVEFALVLPIFALRLFGMVQFGLVFYGWTALRNLSQAGVGLAASDALGSYTGCPQGKTALAANPPVNSGTAALLCTIAAKIDQPAGTTGLPVIALLVQNDVITVCTQIAAEPFTGFFPAMTLSTTGSVHVENPPPALLTATFHDPTVITDQNDRLTYEINGVQQTVTIPPAPPPAPPSHLIGYTTASSLASAVEGAIATSNPPVPKDMQLQVSPIGNVEIQFQPTPPDVAEVTFQVSGSAVGPTALDFSKDFDDNNYVEDYNPYGLQKCVAQ
jgi:Flp pilus assembly protein TadG